MSHRRISQRPLDPLLQQDSWKIFQIMAEFVEGFEHLSNISPAVSIFGSARFGAEHPFYQLAQEIAYQGGLCRSLAKHWLKYQFTP